MFQISVMSGSQPPESNDIEGLFKDYIADNSQGDSSQANNSQEASSKKPVTLEIDSSTYIKTKGGPEKLANFIFSIDSHSLINDRDGNKIYVLRCCTKSAKFKVPVILSDTDSYTKIVAKIRIQVNT